MDTNLAYEYGENWREELIGGRLVAMAPAATNHNRIKLNIGNLFSNFLRNRTCEVLPDGEAVYLTDVDYYYPDAMVVCDPNKIKPDGVYGAPDLVVEVLSPSTARYDRGHKKDIYEKCGVREYWIVDPMNKSVEQYILDSGHFHLNGVYYAAYPDWLLVRMTEKERAAAVTEFNCSLYDDLVVRLEDVFARVP